MRTNSMLSLYNWLNQNQHSILWAWLITMWKSTQLHFMKNLVKYKWI